MRGCPLREPPDVFSSVEIRRIRRQEAEFDCCLIGIDPFADEFRVMVTRIVEDQEHLAALVVVDHALHKPQEADAVELLRELEMEAGPFFNANRSESLDGPPAGFTLYDCSCAAERPGSGS